MTRFLVAVVLGVFFGLYEVAIAPFLPGAFSDFRPLVPLIVLFIVGSSRLRALSFALPAAFVLDAYASFAYDFVFVRYAILIFVLDAVLSEFLTNRSVYAAAFLALLARVLDWLSAWAIGLAGFILDKSPYVWHLPRFWMATLLWDVLLVCLGFLLIVYLTRRFSVRVETRLV